MPSSTNDNSTSNSLGISCSECGSKNTSGKNFLSKGPSIIWFLLIGWLYLVFRTAIIKTDYICNDCDFEGKYRSNASWGALGLIAAIITIIIFLVITNEPIEY